MVWDIEGSYTGLRCQVSKQRCAECGWWGTPSREVPHTCAAQVVQVAAGACPRSLERGECWTGDGTRPDQTITVDHDQTQRSSLVGAGRGLFSRAVTCVVASCLCTQHKHNNCGIAIGK